MNPYLEALGFLGLLCGLSVVSDRLISKESRKELGQKLKSKIEAREIPSWERWGPIAFIDALPPFSFRSLLASIFLSVGALLVVFYIQYFLLGFDFSQLTNGIFGLEEQRRYVILILTVLFGNFVADFLSFTQSLIILGMIKSGTSRLSSLFIFVTDLLASINIFTFVYAFFLALALYYFVNVETRASFVVSLEEEEAVNKPVSEYLSKVGFKGDVHVQQTAELFHLGYGSKFRNSLVIFIGTARVSNEEIGDALLASMVSIYPEAEPKIEERLGSVALDGTKEYAEHDFQLRGSLGFWVNSKSNFLLWYSSAYLQSDEVQDYFFEVATLAPGLKDLDYVRSMANNGSRLLSAFEYAKGWCPDTQLIMDISSEECSSMIAVISADLISFRDDISYSSSFGGQIPLYTFFFTSLSLTFFIYFMYLSMYFIQIINGASSRFSLPLMNYLNFDEHPITVLSFPFNIFCSLIYLWIALS